MKYHVLVVAAILAVAGSLITGQGLFAEEKKAFSDPALQYLYEQGVNFIHRKESDTVYVLRQVVDGTPVFKEGFDDARTICNKVKDHRVVSAVQVFDTDEKGNVTSKPVSCR